MPKLCTVEAPARLLAFLFAAWPAAKKKQVRAWLKYQAVLVNGQPITQFDHPLYPGDLVAIRSDRFAMPNTVVAAGIRVCYEDAVLLVIDKPANLLSMASQSESEKLSLIHI